MRSIAACDVHHGFPVATARLAQSAERKALNLVVVGSSPTVGVSSAQSALVRTVHVSPAMNPACSLATGKLPEAKWLSC